MTEVVDALWLISKEWVVAWVTSGAAVLVIVFLARELLTHWFSKALDAHKQQLATSATVQIEGVKATLRREVEVDLAAWKAELRAASFAREASVVRLQERQLAITEELYKRLIHAQTALAAFTALWKPSPVGSKEEVEAARAAEQAEVAEKVNAFMLYFAENRIFFPEPICEQLDRVVEGHGQVWRRYAVHAQLARAEAGGEGDALRLEREAFDSLREEISPLVEAVEGTFRELAGVNEQSRVQALSPADELARNARSRKGEPEAGDRAVSPDS